MTRDELAQKIDEMVWTQGVTPEEIMAWVDEYAESERDEGYEYGYGNGYEEGMDRE